MDKGAKVDSAGVVLACMRAAELQGGANKLATAKSYVDSIVDTAVHFGLCDGTKGDSIKGLLATGLDSFDNICELFIRVSKDPAFLQIEEAAVKCCLQLRRRSHA